MAAWSILSLALGGVFLAATIVTVPDAAMSKPKFQIIYTFQGGSDGAQPIGGLARDEAGNLYGATGFGGGAGGGNCNTGGGCGTIYKIDARGHESVLYAFGAYPDGSYPFPVVLDSSGNIYGAALWGGDRNCGCGTAYKIDKHGKFTVLHTFENGSDGGFPESALVMDTAGNLYGTTVAGGPTGGCTNQNPPGCGTIYKIDAKGNETVLYGFAGPDGSDPSAALLRDSKGNLFGSALTGGVYGYGNVFELTSAGKFRDLHDFTGSGADNGYPYDGLAEDKSGNLYGTTEWHPAGSNTFGTVFEIARKGDALTTLFTFDLTDGGYPVAGLLRDSKGDLFGTTLSGGDCPYNECGIVFEIRKSGSESAVYNFQEGNDGYAPQAILVSDKAGNLYGTALGGATGDGVVFKIAP